MFEFFIAKRYLRAKHRISFISLISLISVIGITLGVAALVVVLSVFNGFGSLVESMFMSVDPHLRIEVDSEISHNQLKPVEEFLNNNSEVTEYYEFIEGKVILFSKNKNEIIKLKGVNYPDTSKSWGVNKWIVSGELYDKENMELVIGVPMRLRLGRTVTDTIRILSFNNIERSIFNLAPPPVRSAVISGIFRSHNKDFDYGYVFSSLKTAGKIFGKGSNIDGYDVRLDDVEKADRLKKEMLSLPEGKHLKIYTWYEQHEELFNMMRIERYAAYIILFLIVAVGTFNILGSLSMTVIEKKKDIGIMRAAGANKKSIMRIFTFEGLLIGVTGTVLGLVIGLGVCFAQIYFKIYALDTSKYLIDAMPVKIELWDIISVTVISLLLSFLASYYPSLKAVKLNITEAIKWE